MQKDESNALFCSTVNPVISSSKLSFKEKKLSEVNNIFQFFE